MLPSLDEKEPRGGCESFLLGIHSLYCFSEVRWILLLKTSSRRFLDPDSMQAQSPSTSCTETKKNSYACHHRLFAGKSGGLRKLCSLVCKVKLIFSVYLVMKVDRDPCRCMAPPDHSRQREFSVCSDGQWYLQSYFAQIQIILNVFSF